MQNPLPEELSAELLNTFENEHDDYERVEEALEVVLKKFVKHKDEPKQNLIILYFSTNCMKIFGNNQRLFEKFYKKITDSLKNHTDLFQGQIYVHLTNMMILLDMIIHNKTMFEDFVDDLLQIISKVNSSKDRVRRGMACECLIELEQKYPGLLHKYDKYINYLSQKEKTNFLQSYVSLFTIIIRNKLHFLDDYFYSQSGDQATERSSDKAMSIFSYVSTRGKRGTTKKEVEKVNLEHFFIPDRFTTIESQLLKQTQEEKFEKDTEEERKKLLEKAMEIKEREIDSKRMKKYIARMRAGLVFVVESSKYFSVYGKARILDGIFELVKFCEYPEDILRQHFYKTCVYSSSVYLFHSFLSFLDLLQIPFSIDIENRLIDLVNDYLTAPYNRQIGVNLISGKIKNQLKTGSPSKSEKAENRINLVAPTVHDKLFLVHAKLINLINCMKSNNMEKEINKEFLEKSLEIVHDFSCFPVENNVRFRIIFDYLFKLLKTFPDTIHQNLVIIFIMEWLNRKPSLTLRYLEEFLDNFDLSKKYEAEIHKKILKSIQMNVPEFTREKFLCFIPLMKRIFTDKELPPNELIKKIDTFIRKEQNSPGNVSGSWKIGHEIIELMKLALIHHYCYVIIQVKNLLFFISQYYSNLEIKDQAFFLYRLVTHVNQKKVSSFLSKSNEEKEEEANTKKESNTKNTFEKKIFKPFLKIKKVYSNSIVDIKEEEEDILEEDFEEDDEMETTDEEERDLLKLYRTELMELSEDERTLSLDFQIRFSHSYLKVTASPKKRKKKPQVIEVFKEEENEETAIEVKSRKPTKNNKGLDVEKEGIKKIYGITMHFEKLKQFLKVEEVKVAYLERNKDLAFTFQVKINPNYPIPGTFKTITIDFTSEKYVSCQTSVPPVSIGLRDLLKEIPIKTTTKKKIFELIWEESKKPKTKGKYTNMLSSTIKIIKKPAKVVKTFIKDVLKPYCVETSKEFEEGKKKLKETNVKVLCFLSPRYHLLFDFSIREKKTTVKICTDFYHILAFVDTFLNEMK